MADCCKGVQAFWRGEVIGLCTIPICVRWANQRLPMQRRAVTRLSRQPLMVNTARPAAEVADRSKCP